jgi:hypothetical protein
MHNYFLMSAEAPATFQGLQGVPMLPENTSQKKRVLWNICRNDKRLHILASHARQKSSQTFVLVLLRGTEK